MRARIISRLQRSKSKKKLYRYRALNEGQDYIPATTRLGTVKAGTLGTLNEGQDYIPATTGERPPCSSHPPPALNEGQDYIPATTCWYEFVGKHCYRSLNEGQDYIPATTSRIISNK